MTPDMNSSDSARVTAKVALIEELKTNSPISAEGDAPAVPGERDRRDAEDPAAACALPDRLKPVREQDSCDAHDDERGDLREQRAEQAGLRDLDEGEQGDLAGYRAQQDRLDRRVERVAHLAELLRDDPVQ